MAEEQKSNVELVTVKIEEETLAKIQEQNAKINDIVNAFGQFYVRRNELEAEMTRLDELQEKADEDFKSANEEMRAHLAELEKEYPRGQVDLREGTITYRPDIKEQMKFEGEVPASVNEVEEVKE